MWKPWRRHEGELSAELESHLDMHVADNVRAGMTPEEARRHAMIALGGIEQTKERYREHRRSRWVDELMQDVKFAGRMLVRDRGFALTVVIVLAIETLLHGVTPSDPLTYAGAGTLLWLVAFLACAIPALQAARVSPAALLRGN